MVKIVIVDDAAFMRGALKYIVETGGHTVVGTAKNGNEAVELYDKLKPDLVTLDILMKEMDGMTALRKIMEIDPKAKVIMVTSMGMENKQEEARELGAVGYIRKPFKQSDILNEISRVV